MYVFKLYRGDVHICTNQQSIRDVYLVFMSLGPESINCHNHPNTFFKSPVPDTEKKKKKNNYLECFHGSYSYIDT